MAGRLRCDSLWVNRHRGYLGAKIIAYQGTLLAIAGAGGAGPCWPRNGGCALGPIGTAQTRRAAVFVVKATGVPKGADPGREANYANTRVSTASREGG
jgi:hypothetical protein